ncbi:DNA polymerase III subunit delta' [Vibrio hepatarius]|uniref:DNA polymerase III subunit delta' n=1 Tax=Vibrio hepatarius TaxID=171383 RepID=UPI00148B7A1F|nr:DNA polymerase III subunit delta' [Vibrio hepatarius]NOI13364.1 DNA polymerase III subunit delta' [Vibrio hepatarius]
MAQLYPWLDELWQEWRDSLDAGRFSNSAILTADYGLGHEQLVDAFSRAVMCSNYASEACGFCHSCQLMNSGSHPDYHVVEPEKEGKSITVEQIRHCNRQAQESSQLAGVRLFVIQPAEAMNESAANALLKTLEEPSSNCMFLLVTHRPSLLLPTITSRCQQWTLAAPNSATISEWIAQQDSVSVPPYAAHINNNSPLKTLAFAKEGEADTYQAIEQQLLQAVNGQGDVMKFAKELSANPAERLAWIWYLLTDAQKVHFGVDAPFFTPGAAQLAAVVSYTKLYEQAEALSSLIEQLREHTGLNSELLILDWLFKFNEETCL